jgi:hypothetical protein
VGFQTFGRRRRPNVTASSHGVREEPRRRALDTRRRTSHFFISNLSMPSIQWRTVLRYAVRRTHSRKNCFKYTEIDAQRCPACLCWRNRDGCESGEVKVDLDSIDCLTGRPVTVIHVVRVHVMLKWSSCAPRSKDADLYIALNWWYQKTTLMHTPTTTYTKFNV